MSSLRKKRILILSEGFGTGHTQAAHALSFRLRQMNPGLNTRVMELGAFLHPTLAPWIFSAYRKTVSLQPKLYGLLYRNQYQKSLNRFAKLALHRIFYAQASTIMDQLKPDLIVCTHPFPTIIVSRLKQSGLNVPLCTLVTDYDAHGTWMASNVDKYFVSTEKVRQKFIEKGVDPDKIEVTGIPVHPSFQEKHDKQAIQKKFGLKNMPTVMIMGGGWGMLGKEMLDRIAVWRDQIQFLICLGTNEKARNLLMEEPSYTHPNIHIFGYTNEIDKLMEVSDLLITKPGGMTCTEAMAKGIPMLFYRSIPGQEEENCQYFTEQGFGEEITSFETVRIWFYKLLEQSTELKQQREHRREAVKLWSEDCPNTILAMMDMTADVSVPLS